MKLITKLIGILTVIFCLQNADAQNIDLKPFSINTNQYRIDTIINAVKIRDQKYSFIVLRDKYNEQMLAFEEGNKGPGTWLPEQAPITLIVADNTNGNILFHKKLELSANDYPNLNWLLEKGQEKKLADTGKLFFSVDKSYGGSGSTNTVYLIDKSEKGIQLTKLFSVNGELSDYIITKNDQELILISGIWNSKEKEAHFSNHRYQINKLVFKTDRVESIILGTTTNKYPCIDEENTCKSILSSIIKKEPQFGKNIQLTNY